MTRDYFLWFFIFLIVGTSLFSQREISGQVLDYEGLPLPGVNIIIKGTTNGTQTDFDGYYTIQVPGNDAVLVFSYIGMMNKEMPVGDSENINIVLTEVEDYVLEEVLVSGSGVPKGGTKSKKNYAVVRVFFATDRNLKNSKEPGEKFGGKRSYMRYGTCDVSIPKDHHIGELEEASIFKLQFRNDPEKHVTLLNVKVKSKSNFYNTLKKRVSSSPEKNAFIFVHGYNVSFKDASRRTAQISYDIGFNGAPVFYSWPSQGTLLGYNIDQGNIQWSQKNLELFLKDFLAMSSAQNIYLIAHSMGNRGLTQALASIISENPGQATRIKEIILAAPDIDAAIFERDIAPKLIQANKPITLYVSSNDIALVASQKFSSYPRAGQSGTGMLILPGIETIDASNVSSDFLGHSYFGESKSVIEDIYDLVNEGLRPKGRLNLKPALLNGRSYWKFN